MDLVALRINSDEAKRGDFSRFGIQLPCVCIEDTTPLLEIHSLFYFYKISWQYHMPRKKATPLSFPAGQSGDTVNSSPCPTLAHRLSLLSPVLAFHQCPHHGFISIPGLVASPFPCPFLQALPPLTNSYSLTPLFHSPPLKRPDESKS